MYFLAEYYRFIRNSRPIITNCQRHAKLLGNTKNLRTFANKKNKEANTLKNLKPQRRCVMFCGVDCYIGRNNT